MNDGKNVVRQQEQDRRVASTKVVINETLKVVGFAGVLGAAVVAPNSLQAIDWFLKKYEKNKIKRSRLARYIKSQNLLEFSKSGDSLIVTLTEKGTTRFTKSIVWDYEIMDKTWSGSWYILMFDIPEKHKTYRDMLTRKIKEMNMKQLQDSVYVSPYSIDDFVRFLRQSYPQIMNHVMYFTTTAIEGEEQLLKAFSLSRRKQ
jgi:DNA-binding transcriptional regulator PaaX